MNLFLPEKSISESVACLDDRRLIKQILEVAVLIDDAKGYKNHPVKVFYSKDKEFLAHYGYVCCTEYFYRFRRTHVFTDDFFRVDFRIDNELWKRGLYASGSKSSPEYVRETDPSMVRQLFKQKLISKWKNDKIPPKWTNREPPEWYIKENI